MSSSRISRLHHCTQLVAAASTATEVWRGAAGAACEELGFERALAVRLHGNTLVVDGAHNRLDPGACAAESGTSFVIDEIPLFGEMVRTGAAVLVNDAAGDPRVPFSWPTRRPTRSFVIAPVVVGRHTAGFVGADYRESNRHPDVSDREWLAAYAGAVGLALHRVELEERLRHVSRQARTLLGLSSTAREPQAAHPTSLAHHTRHGGAAGEQSVFERLTAREHDVLRLIGQGYTNPQIARELLITRETVKTHVARLNRKLGVANRAEAVAVFERMHLAHRPAPDDADVSFAHAPEFHR